MATFNENYDPGFLNVQGFGQSATNPLAPVYYQAMGIVKDLSVYQSAYVTDTVNAGVSVVVGGSSLSQTGFEVSVPSNFQQSVNFDQTVSCQQPVFVESFTDTKRLLVNGIEYKRQLIKCDNGSFYALVEV